MRSRQIFLSGRNLLRKSSKGYTTCIHPSLETHLLHFFSISNLFVTIQLHVLRRIPYWANRWCCPPSALLKSFHDQLVLLIIAPWYSKLLLVFSFPLFMFIVIALVTHLVKACLPSVFASTWWISSAVSHLNSRNGVTERWVLLLNYLSL